MEKNWKVIFLNKPPKEQIEFLFRHTINMSLDSITKRNNKKGTISRSSKCIAFRIISANDRSKRAGTFENALTKYAWKSTKSDEI